MLELTGKIFLVRYQTLISYRDLPFLFDGHADLDLAREVMDDEASEGECSEEKEMLLL